MQNFRHKTGFGSDIPSSHHGASDQKLIFKGPQSPLEELPQKQNQGTAGHMFQ
jgi:hypothetical protein